MQRSLNELEPAECLDPKTFIPMSRCAAFRLKAWLWSSVCGGTNSMSLKSPVKIRLAELTTEHYIVVASPN